MLRFYLDENVPEALVADLRRLGYDAVSTAQLGRKGSSDARQLLLAMELGRVLITHNAGDFRLLHEAWLGWRRLWDPPTSVRHPGILLIDQRTSSKLAPMGMSRLVHAVGSDVPT